MRKEATGTSQLIKRKHPCQFFNIPTWYHCEHVQERIGCISDEENWWLKDVGLGPRLTKPGCQTCKKIWVEDPG